MIECSQCDAFTLFDANRFLTFSFAGWTHFCSSFFPPWLAGQEKTKWNERTGALPSHLRCSPSFPGPSVSLVTARVPSLFFFFLLFSSPIPCALAVCALMFVCVHISLLLSMHLIVVPAVNLCLSSSLVSLFLMAAFFADDHPLFIFDRRLSSTPRQYLQELVPFFFCFCQKKAHQLSIDLVDTIYI